MIDKLKQYFGLGKKIKALEGRSLRAKELFADSLFKLSNNLFIAAMVWIVTPFLLRFNRLIESIEKYSDLGFWQQFLFLFIDYTARYSLIVYIVLLGAFWGLVVLGVSLRSQAMDILDGVEREKNKVKRK